VCCFRFGNPAGYVIHERTDNFRALFFVSMGPFFLNTLLCMVFCTAAFLPVWELKVQDPLAYFFYWLGLSIGMHAFPSKDDLANIWEMESERAKHGNLLAVISLPLIAILCVLNYARIVWADLGTESPWEFWVPLRFSGPWHSTGLPLQAASIAVE
jgi:hypothetical protein